MVSSNTWQTTHYLFLSYVCALVGRLGAWVDRSLKGGHRRDGHILLSSYKLLQSRKEGQPICKCAWARWVLTCSGGVEDGAVCAACAARRGGVGRAGGWGIKEHPVAAKEAQAALGALPGLPLLLQTPNCRTSELYSRPKSASFHRGVGDDTTYRIGVRHMLYPACVWGGRGERWYGLAEINKS